MSFVPGTPVNILSLKMDADSQVIFDRLRAAHFPPERNLIAAHLTLFHALPEMAEVEDVLRRAAERERRFSLTVNGVRSLGGGVAYTLASEPLMRLHAELVHAFNAYLIPQDRQRFWPHIVVQNKVSPETARALLAQLRGTLDGMTVQSEGLDLWRYLGGPWEHRETFPFADRL